MSAEIAMPRMLLGTFQHNNRACLRNVAEACIEHGIRGFDTAPSYGTEEQLGGILHDLLADRLVNRDELFISTKIDAWQMQECNGRVASHVEKVLRKMRLEYLDQLLIHWPIPEFLQQTWESFLDLRDKGKARVIGVCNVRLRHLNLLTEEYPPPGVIQNERHPLRTDAEMIEFCARKGYAYQAYSPVGQMMPALRDSKVLKDIALGHGCNVGQIIFAWQLQTGANPVFMTTKAARVREYAASASLGLEENELSAISSLNKNHKLFLESVGCPGF